MLKLNKETLVELTSDDLASVVGGEALWRSCLAVSCITGGDPVIHLTMNTDAIKTIIQ